jgi:hypothetical protein
MHPALPGLVDDGERTGWMAPAHNGAFTCATHRPADLRSELADAGLKVDSLVSVEGITFAFPDLDARLNDAVQRALILDTLRALESVPELLGVGPHLLATAHR